MKRSTTIWKKSIIPLLVFFLSFSGLAQVNGSVAGNGQKPNIVLIYADDLGIGLLGHEGQKIIKTPHIDQLAKEGVRFTNAYSNMLCAPARASLITGLHDCHKQGFEITPGGFYKKISTGNYEQGQIEKILNGALRPIPQNQVFLGQVAQEAGYITAQIGKLEWGFSTTDHQMKRHGWDRYYGYLDHVRAHGFYPPFLFEDGKLVDIEGNTLANCGKSGEPETPENFAERQNREGKAQYSQDLFMNKALDFISTNKDRPFFLYFPTQLPHGPVAIPEIHPDFINDERLTPVEKEYASMVKMLDDNVGQIMQKLKELKIDGETLVIFTADNGHEIYYGQKGRVEKPYTNIKTGERFDDVDHKYYSHLSGDVFDGNGGRAGMKRSNLQGGIQVPLIVRWPAKIEAGSSNDGLVANYDLLATMAEVTGFSKPFHTDGISFYEALVGKSTEVGREFVVYSSYTGPTLITDEGWKIRTDLNKQVFELFFLPDDFKEANDLSQQHPKKLKELKSRLLAACEGDLKNGHFTNRGSILKVARKKGKWTGGE
ncbi:arylsulfatase [Zobellia galactanivorans]|uniref:Sulfatase, family S1-20 n=1 Tax=Zobellia galactanivorans (strain DSM 12802 / CCUG 47099 / CIP 106680 / NCIMB 13871 / Dsij) TaxID=63186 RepID=G0L157_ZOBGA|nr:arylsulfatase [Zobellia galactanivorans]CAZ97653.1 Sulfatase, family S1-20 [Zobellia galactanivorans]